MTGKRSRLTKCIMWNRLAYIIGLGAILLSACQREVPDPGHLPEAEEPRQMATFTLQASKSDDTKALSLEGNPLYAYWKDGESVLVYDDSGFLLGSLDVIPAEGEKPSSATLTGTLDVTGVKAGDNLTLMIPRHEWNYTGQVGTLTGENSIEEKYDYASATIEIATVGEGVITATGPAQFSNDQSIYRFGFIENEEALSVRLFVVRASSNKLVQSVSSGETTYGAFKVKPAAATTDLIYVSIRNESVGPACAGDTYHFIVVGSDQSAHLGTKPIPASVMGRQGLFISAKSIAVNKLILPKSSTPVTTVW